MVGSTLLLVGIFCHKPKSQPEGRKDVGCDTLGSVRGSQRGSRQVVSSALATTAQKGYLDWLSSPRRADPVLDLFLIFHRYIE